MEPNNGTLREYYELQRQPKRVGEGQLIAQYGSCTFMPKRNQKGEKLEISFAQKNKWSKDWMQYWFYVRTGGLTSTGDDGRKNTRYPLASVMTPMKPLTQGTPGPGTTNGREAYDKAFALACRYSRGRDLVEEMVVANCWPLGRKMPTAY